ncbi:GNAT family N-acetyltransferase [Neobacillus niacini]|uniref:GNAT family N-acetyltransferase n=1 Tax=Neobacillus niacini TaxID=86668 RepID=UPI001C8E88EA|nr:GNAT family N-acetyltransferase [Neobacillus niacini]MBY0148630.1 GNAT family N-acetyltransferase [Neobacillus niacini]
MLKVEIRRPKIEDQEELNQFFRTVLTDTFAREGLADLVEDIEADIESKKKYLQMDFETSGEKRYFLIALTKNKIIGTITCGNANELIQESTNGALRNTIEIGTIYVLSEYQRQGVGNQLLAEMLKTLMAREIQEFCLDSGFKTAQTIWKKKFGEPEYWLKDYWGQGQDHMIWKIPTKGVYF